MWKRIILAVPLLVLVASVSWAVNFNDEFEVADGYAWDSTYGCKQADDAGDCETPYQPPGGPWCASSNVLGYNGTGKFFADGHADANGCSDAGVNYFTGGLTQFHGASPSAGGAANWLISSTSAGQVADAQSHEMLVSQSPQGATNGWIQVDFKIHGSVAGLCNWSSEHYVLASNVAFNSAACSSSFCYNKRCLGASGSCSTDTTCNGGQEAGCTQDHTFFAVIAGNFGGGGVPNNSCGFALERAKQTCTFGVCTRQVNIAALTNFSQWVSGRWYRMKLQRSGSTYFYNAWQYTNNQWSSIGSKNASTAGLGGDLPLGRVGFYGYWLRNQVHVDIDHFQGSW